MPFVYVYENILLVCLFGLNIIRSNGGIDTCTQNTSSMRKQISADDQIDTHVHVFTSKTKLTQHFLSLSLSMHIYTRIYIHACMHTCIHSIHPLFDQSVNHSLTHSFTHSLTHSLTHTSSSSSSSS